MWHLNAVLYPWLVYCRGSSEIFLPYPDLLSGPLSLAITGGRESSTQARAAKSRPLMTAAGARGKPSHAARARPLSCLGLLLVAFTVAQCLLLG